MFSAVDSFSSFYISALLFTPLIVSLCFSLQPNLQKHHHDYDLFFSAVPELSARGVIQQVFPLHEQRILSQLMKSWVQAVCEKQPLGQYSPSETTTTKYFTPVYILLFMILFCCSLWFLLFLVFTDDICDYFGVKIAMYFAWLGFYTTSMLYPAVIGFVLWMLTESDQVRRGTVIMKQPLAVQCLIMILSMSVCFRRAATSAVWCSHCSTWCGPLCFWSAGRGGGRSWRTSGERWTRLLSPSRNRGLSSG